MAEEESHGDWIKWVHRLWKDVSGSEQCPVPHESDGGGGGGGGCGGGCGGGNRSNNRSSGSCAAGGSAAGVTRHKR